MIDIYHKQKFIATLKKDKEFVLEYHDSELQNSISLSLPNNQKFYISKKILPYFDSFLPEGYLFEIFKNYLIKEFGYIDDFLLFKLLAPKIEGRISYKSDRVLNSKNFDELSLENILNHDTKDTFSYLLEMFLEKNSISGVQPKTVAILKDKESLTYKNYIIKTWGDEFKYLAENEYLCLKTVELADIDIPKIYLSKNKNFLVVERFDSDEVGFEETIALMDKLKLQKYSGSYEQVAKVIYKFLTNPLDDMKKFYKIIVMNYMLKNGDAHLKNFGLLYSDDFSTIKLSPAYDVVTTTAYIFRDKPALMMGGKKLWYGREELVRFGIKSCYLKQSEAENLYDECKEATKKGIDLLKEYILENPHFQDIGTKMLDSWSLSLDEKTYKEVPLEFIRTWSKDKRA